MPRPNRRDFLRTSAFAAGGAVAISHTKSSGKVLGANDTMRVAVAGLNGRGASHVGAYLGMKNVEIAYLVDPDSRTFKKHLGKIEEKGGKPACMADIRKALDSKELDAVSIATPNHWHALMTVWSCQAGKDVYVEKPCSHNLFEGRAAVEAAKKYDRVVQHGTQNRANASWAKLAAVVQSGKLGKLLVSRGLCYKSRKSIGTKPTTPSPAEVDFDLWLGPAEPTAHHANLVHYNWHWFWAFGNGDIGNQGVHQMDVARWLAGVTWPKSVVSYGGRFGYEDQGETPNTQAAVFDYGPDAPKVVFEVRGLKTDGYHGQTIGNVLEFEDGVVANGQFIPKNGGKPQPLPAVDVPARGSGDIFGNFVAAVRSRKTADLHAPIQEGHISSGLGHLANVSYRLGETVPFADGVKGATDAATAETLERTAKHLTDNGVPLAQTKLRVGKVLTFDAAAEKCVGEPAAAPLLTRNYRSGFTLTGRA